MKSKKWTKEEVNNLIINYNKLEISILQEKFFQEKTISAIRSKAYKLNITINDHWTTEEINILKQHHANKTNKFINKLLPNKTIQSITDKANSIGLKKIKTNTQFDKEDLIFLLREFALQLGRTPTSYEISNNIDMPSLSTYVRYFKNYSNACIEANLEINPINIFGKIGRFYASDGCLCFSKAELQITEFFIKNKIYYEKEVEYKKLINDDRCGLMRMDWLLKDDLIIEYFGFPEKEKYNQKMILKQQICLENDFTLLSLTKKDLGRLDKVLNSLT